MNEAVTKAGSTDKEAVRSAFESITGFYGVAGQYNYSADDHIGIHGGMWLFQIEKGEYKLTGTRPSTEVAASLQAPGGRRALPEPSSFWPPSTRGRAPAHGTLTARGRSL